MDIDQLQCVLAIVRHGTYLSAAAALNRSQSSVSKSVQRLERELGAAIFERTTRRIRLTPVGEDIVAYAEEMVKIYEDLLYAVEHHRMDRIRELHVGSIYFGQNNRLIPLVAQFMSLHPSLKVSMEESTTTPLLHQLRDHKLDVVFVSSMYLQNEEPKNFGDDPHYISCSFSLDPYYVVVNRSNPLAGKTALTYQDLSAQRLITIDKAMDVYHTAINHTFEVYGIQVPVVTQCTNIRSALHMVSQNVGIAILTKLVVEESDDLVLIPLENPLIRNTQMVIRRQSRIPPHLNAFYQFIQANK